VSVDLDPFDLARRLHSWGSENPAFDVLMVLGPVVVLAFPVAGRNVVTTAVATVYVTGFVVALAYSAVDDDRP